MNLRQAIVELMEDWLSENLERTSLFVESRTVTQRTSFQEKDTVNGKYGFYEIEWNNTWSIEERLSWAKQAGKGWLYSLSRERIQWQDSDPPPASWGVLNEKTTTLIWSDVCDTNSVLTLYSFMPDSSQSSHFMMLSSCFSPALVLL